MLDASSHVDIQGMGLTVFFAPRHKSLPMGGVQIILGNDLAGAQVWPDVPAPVDTPTSQVEGSESPTIPSVVLPTCAVTGAMSRASGGSCLDNPDKKRVSLSCTCFSHACVLH